MAPRDRIAASLLLSLALHATGQAPKSSASADQLSAQKHAYTLPDGAIRIIGGTATEGIVNKLDALFATAHPGMTLHFIPASDTAAIESLIFDVTLVAPVTSIYGGGIAYSDIVKAPPFAVRIAHASLKAGASVSPLVVIVNPANAMPSISLDRAASIFTKPLRAPVFSHWAQLGVKLPAADRIEPAGLPWTDHYPSEDPAFGDEIFYRRFNAAPPVDSYRVFATYAEVVKFVAHEPGGIGIVPANQAGTNVRVLGLIDGPTEKIRRPDVADIQSDHYPLDRDVYLYARVLKGEPLDPLAADYLQLALSPQGQAAIANEGEGYIPLSATEISEEQAKLQ
jgi:phosphate transport system substrate-binding protein